MAIPNIDLPQDTNQLEEQLMEAAEGRRESKRWLLEVLRKTTGTLQDWPEDVRDVWISGHEMIMEGIDRGAPSDLDVDLVHAVMHAGIDSALMRDVLAAAVRKHFADYLDPARLIEVLGIRDMDTPVTEIDWRWEYLENLREGAVCYHRAQGVGTVDEVDDLAGEVYFRFGRIVHVPLALAVADAVLVKEDSLVQHLRRDSASWTRAAESENLSASLLESLAGPVALRREALHALLDDVLSEVQLDMALGERAAQGEAAETEQGGRSWDAARGIVELVELLRRTEGNVTESEQGIENLRSIWGQSAARRDQAAEFAESVATMWKLAAGAEWLETILREVATAAVCWECPETFAAQSDHLAGRLTAHWFRASLAALGQKKLALLAVRLPLRLWAPLERVLLQKSGGLDELAGAVQTAAADESVSADALVWLWKSGRQERDLLTDPQLVFRVLAKPVSGSYIRGRRDLNRLLMEDEAFQRFLMRGGDENAVASLVRCVRHMPALDAGEKQSLLVRIVRLYPDARSLVEKRQRARRPRTKPRVTSYRSYEQRRRELDAIVKVKTPENARAIAHARSYGDLRENAEYKAAKEEQQLLASRRAELEKALHEVRPTDFADVNSPEKVVPGTTVTLAVGDGAERCYHILGLWDSDPHASIVSFETPVGKLLTGCGPGDSVELPSGESATVRQVEALSEPMRSWVRGDDLEDETSG